MAHADSAQARVRCSLSLSLSLSLPPPSHVSVILSSSPRSKYGERLNDCATTCLPTPRVCALLSLSYWGLELACPEKLKLCRSAERLADDGSSVARGAVGSTIESTTHTATRRSLSALGVQGGDGSTHVWTSEQIGEAKQQSCATGASAAALIGC